MTFEFNRFYIYSNLRFQNLHFFLSILKSWQWKCTQLNIYSIVIRNMQLNTVLLTYKVYGGGGDEAIIRTCTQS
jgi:hypothetical protein